MLTHAEARAAAGYRDNIYDTLYARALFAYRAEVKAAIETYHNGVARVWVHLGRPASGKACQDAMDRTWRGLRNDLAYASRKFTEAPGRCLEQTLAPWSQAQ